MLNFDTIEFDHEPYPVGLARNVLPADVYAEMVATFPTVDMFVAKESKGVKYSLSGHNNRQGFRAHLRNNAAWSRFYDYVRSDVFIDDTLTMLEAHHVDLGPRRSSFGARMIQRFKAFRKGSPQPHVPTLRSRFEFSAMPVTGGSIRPHTDHPSKIVTMVIPILAEGEWDPAYGGGTSIVWPKDRSRSFNFSNSYMDFDEVECLKSYAFEPNQCLVFVKTHNSWHAVWPMTGNDARVLRKTLTINIETN